MGLKHVLAGVGAALVSGLAVAAAPPAKPKLIVAISVDQYAASLFERYRPTYTAGMKRMADGLAFANGYQSHAATETCPGHSTILTGRHPSATGIVANTWFDRASGSSVYCVSVRGTADPEARGPQNLRVDTFGDWLKKAEPGARSVSVSGKDRAAIMLGGHHADAVYWWVDGKGFATSSYAGPATPAVLRPAQAFDAALLAKWKSSPPALWPATVPPACEALEKPYTFGTLAMPGTLPPPASQHVEEGPDFTGRPDFADQLRVSPIFDGVTLDFASRLVDGMKLGRGPATDLLAVSLSTNDYIGHRYGSGGPEMCVQQAALDRDLGTFFARLDALGTPYVLVLTADHGGIDAAERIGATRIDTGALVRALNAHLKTSLGIEYEPIVGDDPEQLIVNAPGDAAFHAKIRDLSIAWLKARPEVAHVWTAEEVVAAAPPPGKSPADLTLLERYHESYTPERSGDIAVAYVEKATLGMPVAAGDVVAGHGTPWDYDRRVPILFWWPGIAPASPDTAIETVDIAPTLAAIVGVPAPAVDGRCLDTVTERCPAAAK